ncbi:hypothetical protein ACGH52_37765 [Streptomyces sp. BBFR25]
MVLRHARADAVGPHEPAFRTAGRLAAVEALRSAGYAQSPEA